MAASLRVYLFDQEHSAEHSFEEPFAELSGVQIVGTTDCWATLQEALLTDAVDAVAVNLDATGDQFGLNVVQHISEVAPDCKIIGVSGANDPDSIIAAMRAGCSQFVRSPIDPSDLRSAVDRIRGSQSRIHTDCRPVCVIGSSGGTGATTIACNLALEFAQLSARKCALVDLNLEFGDIACSFDCKPKYSIADLSRDGVEPDRMLLETAMHDLTCNVSILARPESFDDIREVTPEGIEQTLRLLSKMFPFVVVDMPRSFSFLSAAAVAQADRLLIVTQLGVPFLRNATRIYESLVRMGAAEDRIEIVLNRCNANFERITPEEVASHFARPVFAIVPNDYRRVTASRDLGHPIATNAPNSPARVAIHEMAKKLIRDRSTSENADASGRLGGFWKRKARTGQSNA